MWRNELYHHGILGQKWGEKNGPPYPLSGGDYTQLEKRKIYTERKQHPNSIYNKKHFDETLKKGTTLSTLSYDENRTKNTDMFYATHKTLDKHQYNALFNKPIEKTIYDENGNPIGTGQFLKYRINNSAKRDIKVASEDSGAEAFRALYKNDRDFYNFVTDENRMQNYFVKEKYGFKGYREAKESLDKLKDETYTPTSSDLQRMYRMFNYVLPYDGGGDSSKGKDVTNQRAKFFKELSKNGYGAVLDTNDAIYGGYKATSPVIVFDMKSVMPKSIEQTTTSSKMFSDAVLVGRKIIGV